MITLKEIKAILFDSGRVLNGPVTGNWFITPNFWKYVDKNVFEAISKNRVSSAFATADRYMVSQKLITTKEEEYKHFIKFYEIFSLELPELKLDDIAIKNIAKDLVFNSKKYIFYDDVFDVINNLKSKYKLAVVSDAWPSLLDVFEENNMTLYFDSIVISSFLGTSKPNRKMYCTALEELGVKPEEAIFIDDSLKNCMGAIEVGINAVLLCRNKKSFLKEKFRGLGKEYKVINNLKQLLKML
ncbi:MAG: HAD-IA family hydrolase [Clostridia bacterium]|nr:HAD-IA family hydrolase [Clostridia bacterium]